MSRKISLYIGEPVEAVLAATGRDGEENRSGRLNMACERYMAMVADEIGRLDLTRAEWCAILEANSGVDLIGGAGQGTMIWANLADSPALAEKWTVDVAALVARLRALPRSTLLALREACDRFWARPEMDTDEALRLIGARVKP